MMDRAGEGGEKNPPPPSKGEPANSLYTKSERMTSSFAEWLGLRMKRLICTVDKLRYCRERQKHANIIGSGEFVPASTSAVIDLSHQSVSITKVFGFTSN
jgi:hypothetical protein